VGVWVRDGKHAGPTGYDARLIVNGYSVLSGPTVQLSPASGSVGVVVAVSGSEFAAADTGCTISSSPNGLISSPTCTMSSGLVSGSFAVASGIASGVYSVVVTGTTGDTASASFTVTNSPPTVSGLSPDKVSPQVVGTTITWTCSASDPEGDPILYRFWLQAGSGAWVVVLDWSSSNTWSWTPTVAGTYSVGCWVRDGRHAGPSGFDDRKIVYGYVVTMASASIQPPGLTFLTAPLVSGGMDHPTYCRRISSAIWGSGRQ